MICVIRSLTVLVNSLWSGTHFTNLFSSPFKFNGNVSLYSSRFCWSDCYKIVHITQQQWCHGICEMLQSHDLELNYSEMKFPSKSDSERIFNVCKIGPWAKCSNILQIFQFIFLETKWWLWLKFHRSLLLEVQVLYNLFCPTVSYLTGICITLKSKGCQFDNFVVTGGTVVTGCHSDNSLCHQWQQSCQIDIILFSVAIIFAKLFYVRFSWWHGSTWQWCHNEHDGVSNYQPYDYLLNRLFRRRSKKISKLCVTGLCAGNSPVTSEFPAQRASNTENVFIWWRHHDFQHYWPVLRGIHQPLMDPKDRGMLWFYVQAARRPQWC